VKKIKVKKPEQKICEKNNREGKTPSGFFTFIFSTYFLLWLPVHQREGKKTRAKNMWKK